MVVRANKPAFNVREKLKEIEKPSGVKGNELIRAESTQDARDFISAGRKNLVINGDLRLWQRATSATLNNSTSQTYKTADRWSHYHQTDGAVTESQSTDVPAGAGFYYSLKHEVSTADTSIASGQYHTHRYGIEGHDVAHLMWGTSQAKTITVSFWAKSSVPGDYGFCIRPGANFSRFYVDTLTISEVNIWKKYSFTVPGCTDGTWEKTTSVGLEVQISHSMGSTYTTSTLRQWTSSLVVSPTTQVNWMATVGNTWYITGLQVEVGKNATDFDHRPVGQELALCQRYYYRIQPTNQYSAFCNGWNDGTTTSRGVIHFPITMRTRPTTLEQTGTASDYYLNATSGGGVCTGVPTFDTSTQNQSSVNWTKTGLTAGQATLFQTNVANAYLAWSAEL